MADLRQRKIQTKVRHLSSGRTIGGIPLGRGSVAHLLRNRFYIGEVAFKGEILSGEQPAILDRTLFEAVQHKLDEQRTNHTITRTSSDALLMGRIFDDRGNRMTPSYAQKGGKRYRYYLSSALSNGQLEHDGAVRRVPASEIETIVIDAVRKRIKEDTSITNRELIDASVGTIEVHATQIVIKLAKKGDRTTKRKANNSVIYVPWKKTQMKRRREIIAPARSSGDIRPIRSETRLTLVTAIYCGRRWLDEIVTGIVIDAEQIAAREKCSVRQVNMTISLAFLSPALVIAAVDGTLPRGVGVARLRDAPAEWSKQHAMLGLAS